MRVVVTGAYGFIGKNLCVRLAERGDVEIERVGRDSTPEQRRDALAEADALVHLAGVNRPSHDDEFAIGNADFSTTLCEELAACARAVPVIYASSIQADRDTPYGRSKLAAEQAITAYANATTSGYAIFRLANVFGKWARPNYNSAVATFCHNAARGLPFDVHDASAALSLVYIDDVVDHMFTLLDGGVSHQGFANVDPVYDTTVGEVADLIREFAASRETLTPGAVGSGLRRALYSTFVSYLPVESFSYPLTRHEDQRGVFAEFLRTPDAGQFSFFSAAPGVTRGGHYHHSKTEKFLVVKGSARFGFRHLISGERHELTVRADESRVVDTAPGWAHDITNIGDDEMIVALWANETFDRTRPDTVACPVSA